LPSSRVDALPKGDRLTKSGVQGALLSLAATKWHGRQHLHRLLRKFLQDTSQNTLREMGCENLSSIGPART
jgi:hypothetical protein